MALTQQQKADIRLYCGWSARWHQADTRLEGAMYAVDGDASVLVQIQNAISATPPGLLAILAEKDAQIRAATARMAADRVGTIELNRQELSQLRSQGRQYVARLCSILGVERGVDVFSPSAVRGFAGWDSAYSGGSDNYVGK